jgi:hypothetical protein
MDWMAASIIVVCGGVGGLVNVFLDESGFHLPKTEQDVWRPGYLGIIFVGMIAALGSWLMTTPGEIRGTASVHSLPYSALATALLVGFGGSKWFRSEGDSRIYQKAAAIAASREPDQSIATQIAGSTPMQTLAAVSKLPNSAN